MTRLEPLAALRRRVSQLAPAEGRLRTPIPELWFFRWSRPTTKARVEARMVTLAVIVQGRKRVEIAGRELVYGPGDYLFVTGERKYLSQIEDATPERPYLSMGLELPPASVARVLLALTDAGLEPPAPAEDPGALVAPVEAPIEDALVRLVDTLGDPVGRPVLAEAALSELLVHLLRGPAGLVLRQAVAGDDGRIRRAAAFLESHAHERLTVAEVARHARMSPSHFAHRFREVIRMTPMQYLKHVRLQRARLRMLEEGLGAAEAAAAVGYASASHFARDFKTCFGAPPAAYVQRLRAS